MGIGTGAAILGPILGGTIGAVGSNLAAGTQAKAAQSAQQLQAQEAANALAFQKQQYATEQQQAAPFLAGGTQAENELSGLTSTPGQGLLTPWTGQFQAPTAQQAAQTPGYQFQLQQGEQALQNSAAAKGGLLSGGTAKSLDQYSQGLASTDYQNTYNNAFNQYLQQYNQFQQNQGNEYNRLAGLAGAGQQQVQTLGNLGQQAANTSANIDLTTGQQQGQDLQNAGAATASGYAGITNAAGAGVAGLSGLGSQLSLLNMLNGGGSASGQNVGSQYGPYATG